MANMYRLAGIIWTAIFMIAVQFVPSSAQAHAGHQHDRHQRATQMAAPKVSAAPSNIAMAHGIPAQAVIDYVANPMEFDSELYAPGRRLPNSQPSNGCAGGCCCGSGPGCCPAAAIAGSGILLPQFEPRAEIIALAVGRPCSLDPESLARPPKSLA